MKVNVIVTSNGSFIVKKNTDINKGIKVYNMSGVPLFSTANVEWWDVDGIIKALEERKDLIAEREKTLSIA